MIRSLRVLARLAHVVSVDLLSSNSAVECEMANLEELSPRKCISSQKEGKILSKITFEVHATCLIFSSAHL